MKERTTSLLVAALLAAFTLSHQLYAQSTNVKTPNKNQSAKFKSGIFKGSGNLIQSNSIASFIGGGQSNVITTNATNAVIGGGFGNIVSNNFGTVGGGISNTASSNSSTVGGGFRNRASGSSSTVAGGVDNLARGEESFVGGGRDNMPSGLFATVAGGNQNQATNSYTTVGGGRRNKARGESATVAGGTDNAASGAFATVPGGVGASASHTGSFVWSGDSAEVTRSFDDNTFTVRCEGGARFYTANGTGTGASLAAGSGSWTSLSDRNAKANFRRVNATDVLAKVAAMPVMTWNYKTQDESIRHIGPTAQDFRAAFGVGESETGITTVDADGVALAAIQGLVEELKERDRKIAELEMRSAEVDDLKAKLQAVEERLNLLPPAP